MLRTESCLRTPTILLLICTAAILFGGCASDFIMVYPKPPEKFEKLGPAEGTATGHLAVLSTAYNFIPIALNSRVERAYWDAVESVPGATGLINVTISEDWYWWVLATARKVTVTGEAIREVK